MTGLDGEGSRVKVVLREHDVGALGLWCQVLAAGKPLLARPMAVVAGGRALGEAAAERAPSNRKVKLAAAGAVAAASAAMMIAKAKKRR